MYLFLQTIGFIFFLRSKPAYSWQLQLTNRNMIQMDNKVPTRVQHKKGIIYVVLENVWEYKSTHLLDLLFIIVKGPICQSSHLTNLKCIYINS